MNSRVANVLLPIIAVIVYICIDFVYIFASKSRYEQVIRTIQKEQMDIDVVAAIFCYILMAAGWYFIALQLAFSYFNRLKVRSPTWTPLASTALSGLVAGVLYGLVVYGVYNLTTRALFNERYPVNILLQDMAWGSLFNMVFTGVYMIIWGRLTSPVEI